MAKLYFNYGAMASGKTIELIETAYKYNQKGKKVVLIKPKIDTKGDNKVISRIGLERKADILLEKEDKIFNYFELFKGSICILVDEAQFLTEQQVFDLFLLTKKHNIPVICYGLRTDFQANGFPGSIRLLELADELNELISICECGAKARFNARKINGKYVNEGEQVYIGADESYEPLCGECYIKKVIKNR